LEKRTGKKVDDLHRHFIDSLTFEENGKVFKRIPEVFDCWFESGSMPYAQNHYPFENQEKTGKSFPADFIGEGLDQTRGWFYTLHVLGTALFDQPAFKNVIVNGILLAEDGNKMSKRLKNYPEPEKVIHQYGADAIRLFLLGSNAVIGDDLRFSEKGVEQVMRQVLIPFWNAYQFFAMYAKIYSWSKVGQRGPISDIDRWILSRLQKLIEEVTEALDRYTLKEAVSPFVDFIEALTNWYIRRSRGRFWADEDSPDRQDAFYTLHTVLITLSKVAAPFIPFLTEEIFLQLRGDHDPESVHLCAYPKGEAKLRDCLLEKEMEATQSVVSSGHALRKEHKLKVRQPLKRTHVVTGDPELLAALKRQEALIKEELNVHEVLFSSDEEAFVKLVCKPNFRVLGKKVGPKMRFVQEKISQLGQKQMRDLLSGLEVAMDVEGEEIVLTAEDLAVDREVREGLVAKSEGEITIALDTALDEELLLEGIARELVNKINTMRRDQGFYVTDRIEVTLETTERVKQAFEKHGEYVCGEVLAVNVRFASCAGTEWDLNGEGAKISILLVS
jgi:isoleucyl-tRNA synthetase